MADNTSNERKRRVANGSGNVHKRGDGLGTGPVGNGPRGENPDGSKTGQGSQQQNSSRPTGTQRPNNTSPSDQGERSTSSDLVGSLVGAALSGGGSSAKKGGLGKYVIIIAIIALLGGGGTGLSSLLGGGDTGSYTQQSQTVATTTTQSSGIGSLESLYGTSDLSSVLSSLGISGLLGGTGQGSYDTLTQAVATTDTTSTGSSTTTTTTAQTTGTYNTWSGNDNTGKVDETVEASARAKRTVIKGNGKDVITIMVYLCGTDLESKYKMGTSDLQEMLNASLNSNINLIVYTGGCKKWNNSVVSSSTNQIYQLKDGKMYCLSDNEGAKAMTDPSTLSGFIKYCSKNFPANRYELILWDHGGGSVTGYGYDEKYSNSGSMDLSGISTALKDAGVSFDFIGFDACLMATAETALMLDDYADYMIASEESEPGVGWYYTDWLTKLSKDTSMSTVNIGKNICDDFVRVCGTTCKGQTTTLSVIDLAEFAATVPSKLNSFANATTDMLKSEYKTVASARNNTHEFAASSRIDQIDLIHFAKNLGTDEAKALEKALLSAIKYNKTSSDVTNAYGVSIYFPYKSTKYVKTAVNTYNKIGLDTSYSKCIQTFASQVTSGQVSSGGTSGSYSSLLGMLGGSSASSSYSSSSSSDMTTELVSSLLSSFLGGRSMTTIDGLDETNMDFMTESELSLDEMASYIAANHFDGTNLEWKTTPEGNKGILLDKEQWSLVTELALSMYYDDGEGYMDLGVDNIFCFDDNGYLLVPQNVTWMAVCDNLDGENPQVVAFYYDSMVDDGVSFTITGHIPAFLNDDRVNLLVVFDNENPYGYIAGAQRVYTDADGVEVLAKSSTALEPGDKLDFICDYYSYEGEYLDTYYLGEQMKVTSETSLWSVELDKESTSMMYRFKDIYNQTWWSAPSDK